MLPTPSKARERPGKRISEMPRDEDERCESQQADTQRHEHEVS
jgi:hypothetical protein